MQRTVVFRQRALKAFSGLGRIVEITKLAKDVRLSRTLILHVIILKPLKIPSQKVVSLNQNSYGKKDISMRLKDDRRKRREKGKTISTTQLFIL
jgi:hypothetical protein